MRSWFLARRYDFLALLLLACAAVAILFPLWSPGIPNPGDFLMSVHRIYELASAWENGIFYPRFGLDLNFGYTAPLFQYYPPLASYIGLAFHQAGMGFIAAAKAVASLSLLLAGWGAYAYTVTLLKNRFAAFVAASCYLLAPYLLMVIYERGAVSESLTWAILPWLLWATHRYAVNHRRGDGLAVAALVALTLLGHNATALFVAPLAALYAAVLAIVIRDGKALLRVAGAFILGASLSAFYWAPALLEMNLTKSTEFMFSGGTSVEANVKQLITFAQTSLVALYAGPERFRFALWPLLAALAGVIGLVAARRRPPLLWFWVGVLGVTALLQLDLSLPFWQRVPFVRYIQFPWRLYGIIAFSIAILFGTLFAGVRLRRGRNVWQPIMAIGLLMLFAWLSLTNLRPERLPIWEAFDEAGVNQRAMWERGQIGYPLFGDYTLRTLSIDDRGLALSRPVEDPMRLPPIVAPEKLEVRAENPVRYVLDVRAAQPWTLRLHRPYFPGWQVLVDGTPVNVAAGGVGGLVSAELPAGDYRVVAALGDNDLRRAANVISIVALAIWLVWLLPWRRWWLDVGLVIGLSVAIGAFITYLQTDGRFARYPLTTQANFAEGIRLVGLDLPTTTVCADDALTMRLYWFTDRTPRTDFKIFLHVTTLDDATKVAQVDTMPFDSFNPMTRWEPGELVDFAQAIPLTGVAPGRYRVLFGLYDQETGQNLQVEHATFILPGDRVQLTEIDVVDCTP
ncbi:MAG TPA: hypothetical protein DCL15_03980 [Chloroflexi bacterium]|nr:hypothetical protein [Chloroflexota bacterium]HHW86251.1 hypothetical protein [Chloroflexota bacterium]